MQAHQREFIEFAIAHDALKFGEFTLKSGRVSPYFFNTGQFSTGDRLKRLGEFYAETIVSKCLGFDRIFGPAYKGIPIAAATAIALATHHGLDVPYVFNRKEAKDHGEGGITFGSKLEGRVLIVDDVISDGASKAEAIRLIREAGAIPAGVVIALDRQERGAGERSAVQEIEATLGVPVTSIITLADIFDFLSRDPALSSHRAAVAEYRRRYGAQN
jgi:orotate phosphoribosyltransferase